MTAHSKLFSPSGAEGWFACPGRPKMEEGLPDDTGDDAFQGSARHLVCAAAITEGKDVIDYVGRDIVFWKHPESDSEGECFRDELTDTSDPNLEIVKEIEYDEEWLEEDQDYVNVARTIADGNPIEVELRVDFQDFTGHPDPDDSFGHLDVSVLRPLAEGGCELVVMDRKTGRIAVHVERNKQLMIYALGRYQELSLMYDIRRVRLVIHQREAQEWDCSIEELLAFGNTELRPAAQRVLEAMTAVMDREDWERTYLNPNPTIEACAHCRAMSTCPSMQRAVQQAVACDFPYITEIVDPSEFPTVDVSTAYKAVPMIEAWCESVKADLRRRLMEREPNSQWKLAQLRQGSRKWKDPLAAEKYMKETARLKADVMYTKKVITPTAAEKLVKTGDMRPGQWEKLQAHVTRGNPAISIVPITDKHEAYVPPDPTADFPTLPTEEAGA